MATMADFNYSVDWYYICDPRRDSHRAVIRDWKHLVKHPSGKLSRLYSYANVSDDFDSNRDLEAVSSQVVWSITNNPLVLL
jgi:hypothetical protein